LMPLSRQRRRWLLTHCCGGCCRGCAALDEPGTAAALSALVSSLARAADAAEAAAATRREELVRLPIKQLRCAGGMWFLPGVAQ
jgi:hypothetical protein